MSDDKADSITVITKGGDYFEERGEAGSYVRIEDVAELVKAAQAAVKQAKVCGEFMLDEGYKRGNDLLEDAEALCVALKPFEETP